MQSRILALCAGYGGLEMALAPLLGGRAVAYAEKDPHAASVFAAHHPGIPNLGDVSTADWHAVREQYRPDIVTAGFPCQDISNAGRRVGIHGARSGIWSSIVEAVRGVRPRLVFLENVAAIRSRGLDVVTADLAALGYDARWTCIRAGDPEVGAPHPRDRWFCVAHPAATDPDGGGWSWRSRSIAEAQGRNQPAHRSGAAPRPTLSLLPTPAARDWKSGASNLLGTNARPLNEVAVNLLPQPCKAEWVAVSGADYGPAIRRWEAVTGREAPHATEPGVRTARRLSPLFAEWMMGLPEGHVTGLGLSRNEQLRIIGNGVVPQQAAYAYRLLLDPSGQQALF